MCKLISKFVRLCFTIIFAVQLISCTPARRQIPIGTIPEPKLVSPSEEQYGHTILEALSQDYYLDYNDPRLNKLQEIVDRLAKAAKADNQPWHVFLFRAGEVKNAAATRGNHVFVWSGLLDSLRNDDEIATVLAHEMAHLLAGHTDPDPNEQLRKILISVGAVAAGVAVAAATHGSYVSTSLSNTTTSVTGGLGQEALLNPYSREREFEADHIGLMIMAAAGYNPENEIRFWERVQNDPALNNSIEFMSSHPTTSSRIDALKQALPRALEYYNGKRFDRDFGKSSSLDIQTRSNSKDIREIEASDGETLYIIVKKGAKLYRAPKKLSRSIGEFQKGAKIGVVGEIDNYLEVINPDIGYVKKQDAQRLP